MDIIEQLNEYYTTKSVISNKKNELNIIITYCLSKSTVGERDEHKILLQFINLILHPP